MSTAFIELNDSGILCRHGDVTIVTPGCALLTKKGIITGEQALQQAWLLPQQAYNQYWHQLNLSPLAATSKYARHHADLAYAQLQALYEAAGRPEEVVFAVPGNVSNDQLSVLLGLVKASAFTAAGLVDAGVAAASLAGATGRVLHVDMQMHTAVVTELDCSDMVARRRASQYPELALKGFFDIWAGHIANRFIEEYRYDPLHTAAGEQQLRDLLPDFVAKLVAQPELEIELTANRGNFRLNILRSELLAASHARWQHLIETMGRLPAADVLLLSHRVAVLPGVDDVAQAIALPTVALSAEAAVAACQRHLSYIVDDRTSLGFITALPVASDAAALPSVASPPTVGSALEAVPTHVLYDNTAYPVASVLAVMWRDGALQMTGDQPLSAVFGREGVAGFALRRNADSTSLYIERETEAVQCSGNAKCLKVGDTLVFRGQSVTLIEVH